MEYINRIELQGVVGTIRTNKVMGMNVANFSLSTEHLTRLTDGAVVNETTWHNVVAWEGKDTCDLSLLGKGVKVNVTGRIRTTRYTGSDGTEKTFTEVVASELSIVNEDEVTPSEQVTIKGVIADVMEFGRDYCVTIMDDKGRRWSVVVADENRCCDLVAGHHCMATGRIGKGFKDSFFATLVDEWGRICSHCGKHITEGYFFENTCEYACSDECAIALRGSEQEFKECIVLDEDGELAEDSPCYWTEWE